jgi:hypothetical protein
MEINEAHRMPSLRSFLDDTLRQIGPSTVEDLATAARTAGATKARNPMDVVRSALRQSDLAIPLVDGRWTWPGQILDGAVLTHRVRTPTLGRLDLWPRDDLFPFLPIMDRDVPLASGGVLRLWRDRLARPVVLVGPSGWLPMVTAGALLAFRWKAGALHVTPTEVDPAAIARRVELLRETLAYHHEAKAVRHSLYPLPSAMVGALLEVPDLLAVPLPPLGEVLADVLAPPAEAVATVQRPQCCPRAYEVRDQPYYYDEPWQSTFPPTEDSVVRSFR